ncbi:MAG: hypothetical protein HDT28_04320 [Clostridiales bacterium]|nr:hypothetical protein [Clostridiales bacterium]
MAGFVALLIVIIAAYLALALGAFPKLFFSTRYSVSASSDRFVKSGDGKDNRGMVFYPTEETSEYISRYALSDRDGKRVLVCKLNKPIDRLDYDVVVFDGKSNVRRVFNVKDDVGGGDYTHAVELPFDTVNVSLVINEADGVKFDHNIVENVSGKRIFGFCIVNAVLLAAAVYGIRVCMGYIFGGLYAESFWHVSRSNLVSGLVAAALVLVDIITVVSTFAVRRKRNGVKK